MTASGWGWTSDRNGSESPVLQAAELTGANMVIKFFQISKLNETASFKYYSYSQGFSFFYLELVKQKDNCLLM